MTASPAGGMDLGPGPVRCPFTLEKRYLDVLLPDGRRQGLPRAAEALVLAAAAAITASTLLVKQHLLADIAAGLPWAFAAWFAAGRLYPRLAPGGATHREAFRALVRRAALPAVAAVGLLILARMAVDALGR